MNIKNFKSRINSVLILFSFCLMFFACDKAEIKSTSQITNVSTDAVTSVTEKLLNPSENPPTPFKKGGLSKEKLLNPSGNPTAIIPAEDGENKKVVFSFDNVPWCVRAYNKFGCSLFNEVFTPEKNTFISPISISLALAMTYNGAESKTKEEMASVLNISGYKLSSFNKANEELIEQLTPDNDSLKLSIANSLWAKENALFKKPFLNAARNFYHAEIENVDFFSLRTVPRINKWVEKKTENKIKDLLKKNDVNRDTLLILINAIYFKDKWEIPFEKRFTKMKDFYLTDGTTNKVPMMSNSDDYSYFESPECQAIQLPYSDNRLKMVIFLPAKNSSLKDFLETFSKNDWEEHIKKFRMKKGTVLLPKFKMEFKIKLNETLSKLGMPTAFDKNHADFQKMCELKPDENIFINKIIHKAFIEVDEKGTEAAAATFVAMECLTSMAPSQPFKMIIDRPFFFTIYDSRSKAILFMGTVANP